MASILPGNYPISHYRGDTFDRSFVNNTATAWDSQGNPTVWAPVDMTGGTLLAQIRATTDYTSAVLATFDIDDYVPALGSWTLHMDASVLMTAAWTIAHYDIQYTDANGNVQTLVYGEFDMSQDVSH
jgi:hypothetical protein